MTQLERDIFADMEHWRKLYESTMRVPVTHFTSITGAVAEFNRVMQYTNVNLRREIKSLARTARRVRGLGPSGPVPYKRNARRYGR